MRELDQRLLEPRTSVSAPWHQPAQAHGREFHVAKSLFAASGWSYERTIAIAICAAVALRLVCAAFIPLAGDETLFWRYSHHLAAGYLDHPLMNPLLIRAGTSLFGDSPFGIRCFVILLGLPSSWAVWRAAKLLFRDPRAGATAAGLFNLTLVMSIGSMLATSDASVVAASALLLWALAEINAGGRGAWWLAVGAAFGLGMLSKYTTAFFAPSILAWLILLPEQRRWLRTLWPYAAGAIALALFSPVLIWNAQHGWASAIYQSSRMIARAWSLRYLFELVGSQIGLATPAIFLLAAFGLYGGLSNKETRSAWALLLAALIAPVVVYFVWHSLHERVQPNWLECVYPALACAAAGALQLNWSGAGARWTRWAARFAAPTAVCMALLFYTQAILGILPLGHKDPTLRVLGAGWPALAARIDAVRQGAGAPIILTTDYSLASELPYYLPSHPPVQQISDRIRWVNEPHPDPALFRGSMLYVCKNPCGQEPKLPQRFGRIEYLATVARSRGRVTIEQYSIYRLSAPRGPVLDPLYPVRLKGAGDDSL